MPTDQELIKVFRQKDSLPIRLQNFMPFFTLE